MSNYNNNNNPYQDDGPGSYQPQYQQGQQQQYVPPPGPPPSQQPPHRSGTFNEADFVPENERGQQREAMQQFEMDRNAEPANPAQQHLTQQERDVAQLQAEFPGLDGSVVAAIYGDSPGEMGAAREVLQELSASGAAAEGGK